MGKWWKSWIGLIAASFFCCVASSSRGAVWFEAIDMGVPTNGSIVMTGYRGYVIQVVSNEGPLSWINVGNGNGIIGRISGGLAQRWEDPTGMGQFGAEAAIRSPGPMAVDNTFNSDFNFDSHFIFDPADVTLDPITAHPTFPLAHVAYETDYFGLGFITADNPNLPPGYFMPLQTSPVVGYGVAWYPFVGANYAELLASFHVNENVDAEVFPFAYVVSNSGFDVLGAISTRAGGNYGLVYLHVQVPEPMSLSIAFTIAWGFSRRTRRS